MKHTMDTLDQLLTAHVGRCIEDEAAYFLSLDVTDIEYNETIKQRILNFNGRHRRDRGRHATAKIILVAALLALSLIFTACMTIPKIRAALWRIVIDQHEDHISVRFEQETSETTATATAQTKAPPTTTVTEPPATTETTAQQTTAATNPYPKILKHWAYATYLPKGYTLTEEMSTPASYMAVYCATVNVNFSLAQVIIDSDDWLLDYEEGDILTNTQVNGFSAILIEYPKDPGCYSLTWQDEKYSYNLFGYFPSKADPLKVAQGLKLKKIPAQTTAAQATTTAPPQTTVAETTPTPPKSIEQVAYIDRLPNGWYGELVSRGHIATVTNYFEPSGNLRFVLSQLVLSANDHLDS